MLEEIAASPPNATAIPITVKMTGSTDSVQVKVDLNAQLLFRSQLDGGWKSDFEVVFFQFSANNTILDMTTQNVNTELTPAKYNEATERGINTLERLRLKPEAAVLYVIVHDGRADAQGSVCIPLGVFCTNSGPKTEAR